MVGLAVSRDIKKAIGTADARKMRKKNLAEQKKDAIIGERSRWKRDMGGKTRVCIGRRKGGEREREVVVVVEYWKERNGL